jgi:hypothetical protein
MRADTRKKGEILVMLDTNVLVGAGLDTGAANAVIAA